MPKYIVYAFCQLKGSYDAFFKDHYFVYLVQQNMLTCFNIQKTYIFFFKYCTLL